jgi:hypothetical protein
MTAHRLLTEKNPMTTVANTAVKTYRSRSADMNLINEALSRARMRLPREEARSARRVAMQARRRQARELGDVSQLMLR